MSIFGKRQKPLPFDWGTATSVGKIRSHNEDSFLAKPPIFAVADGMGGHAGGEVASSIAITTFLENTPSEARPEDLACAIEAANIAVIEAAEKGEGRPGMGTTLTAISLRGDHVAIGHVGDSRFYLLHDRTMHRITHDHSFVEELIDSGELTAEEARHHPQRSVITRALGSERSMRADHMEITVEDGDRLLLCSDGVTTMLSDEEIEDILASYPTAQEAANELIIAADTAGGHDNSTAVVVDITNDGAKRVGTARTAKAVSAWLAAVAVIIAITVASVWIYAENSWYLQELDGHVAVYNGIPGGFGPFGLSSLENQTAIPVAELPSSTARRLNEGISVGNREEADNLLTSYREQIEQAKRDAATKAAEAEDARRAVEESAAAEPVEDASEAASVPELVFPAGESTGGV